MYCVIRASAPSLYNVYRRYDTSLAKSPRTIMSRSTPCHAAYAAVARSVLMRMRICVFAHACVMYARISIFGAPWRSSSQ